MGHLLPYARARTMSARVRFFFSEYLYPSPLPTVGLYLSLTALGIILFSCLIYWKVSLPPHPCALGEGSKWYITMYLWSDDILISKIFIEIRHQAIKSGYSWYSPRSTWDCARVLQTGIFIPHHGQPSTHLQMQIKNLDTASIAKVPANKFEKIFASLFIAVRRPVGDQYKK